MIAPDESRLMPTPGVVRLPRVLRPLALPQRGLTLIFLAVLLWGTTGPVIQMLTTLGPARSQSVGFFRLVLALPVLLIACRVAGVRLRCRLSRPDLLMMLAFGLPVALFQISFVGAITGVGATVATLISVCLPPLLVTLAAARLH